MVIKSEGHIYSNDYVTKPFKLRELLSRIRALLRRTYGELSMAGADLLYAGDLVIDRGRGQVWRGSHLINLTPIRLSQAWRVPRGFGRGRGG
jgi:DNA-binding response OmpR family regulator